MSRFSRTKAFTLVELSVVIVIISLLVAAVLISRVLVDSARINKIQEDYRSYNASIQQFQTAYNCVPGDCVASQLADPQFASLNSACIVTSPTGTIDSETKRTCMFHEMHLAGIMSGVDTALSGIIGSGGVGTSLTSVTALAESIAGQNMPFALFSHIGAWDFTLIKADALGNPTTFPAEIGSGMAHILDELIGQHILALRDARGTTCGSGNYCGLINPWTSSTLPALSSKLAYKLDTKFDDGMPFRGNIIGGLFPSVWATKNSCIPVTIGAGFTKNERYLQGNNVMQGCMTIYTIIF